MFWGNEIKDNGCVKGINYLLSSNGKFPKFHGGNISSTLEDVEVMSLGRYDRNIRVSRVSYKSLRRSKEWNYFKKYIERE